MVDYTTGNQIMTPTDNPAASNTMTECVALQALPGGQMPTTYQVSNLAGVVAVALLAGIIIGRKSLGQRTNRHGNDANPFRDSNPGEWKTDSEFVSGAENWQLNETKFCPICRAEYIPPTTLCEDCVVELVEEWDIPDAETRIEENVVRVARIPNSMSGQLLRGYLSANHIPCMVSRSSPWDIIGADLYVFESDALRVKRILRYHMPDLDATLV